MKSVSVIIPAFHDTNKLKKCLCALECQTFPRERFELVVVNNGSKDDFNEIIPCFPKVRFLFEPTPGSYAARNRGIRETESEILAFTDADCIPNAEWLEQGVRALCSIDNCGLAAGDVRFFFQNPSRPTVVELFDDQHEYRQEHCVANLKFG